MANFVIGKDIFQESGDLYLITVNTVGAMGKGLAENFAIKFPELFKRYKHDCKMKIITIGNPAIYQAEDGKHYMMFPTKENWRNDSRYDYIAEGLHWMTEHVGEEDGEINPKWKIVVPPLGCGNGNLKFPLVSEMIKQASEQMPNEMVVIYPPWMQEEVVE
jgi:hypothetical protein